MHTTYRRKWWGLCLLLGVAIASLGTQCVSQVLWLDQRTAHWTPDGSHVVFGHSGRILIVDREGRDLRSLSGGVEQLSPFSAADEVDFSPTLSPDGSMVAYSTLRYNSGDNLWEYTYEIAVQSVNGDGSDRRRLTNNDIHDVSPAWSPDGSRIAYVSYPAGGAPSLIYTMAVDGSDARSVAPSVERPRANTFDVPVWSPDGSRLAFIGFESAVVGQWLYPEEGEAFLVPEGTIVPAATLEGIRRTEEETLDQQAVYTVKADGSALTKLAWASEGPVDVDSLWESVGSFVWSPDGSHVAFVARYSGGSDELYIAPAGGSERAWQVFKDVASAAEDEPEPGQYRLGGGQETILDVAWTPDGSRLRFIVDGYTKCHAPGTGLCHAYGLYTVASDGSDLRFERDTADRNTYGGPSSIAAGWRSWLTGPGPARIVQLEGYDKLYQRDGGVLSTIPWGALFSSYGLAVGEQVLVRVVNDRFEPAGGCATTLGLQYPELNPHNRPYCAPLSMPTPSE